MLTLKKVKELVEAPSHAKRTPSPKMLFEEGMNFTDNPFERMMRQRPGTDSGHPCKHCRHKWECGYLLHQCRKKFRSVLGDTAPPAAEAVRP